MVINTNIQGFACFCFFPHIEGITEFAGKYITLKVWHVSLGFKVWEASSCIYSNRGKSYGNEAGPTSGSLVYLDSGWRWQRRRIRAD